MTLPAERFELTPIASANDPGTFDVDELAVKSPSVEDSDGAQGVLQDRESRGEDAHKRFLLAELRIIQENIRRFEDDIAVEDDIDDDVFAFIDLNEFAIGAQCFFSSVEKSTSEDEDEDEVEQLQNVLDSSGLYIGYRNVVDQIYV